jgi:pentatricopeptide repeat protein
MEGAIKHEENERAEKWLKEMIQEGVRPSVLTFTAMVEGAAKRGKMGEARGWIREMRQEGLQLDVDTGNLMIERAVIQGDMKLAKCWFNEMNRDNSGRPNNRTFSLLIEGEENRGNAVSAQAWRSEMKPEGLEWQNAVKGRPMQNGREINV